MCGRYTLRYDKKGLEVYPVSPKVNRAGTDEPGLLEAVGGVRA